MNTKYETPQGLKTEIMQFRVTPEDKALLIEQAKKYRISISALLRLMLSELTKKDLRFK